MRLEPLPRLDAPLFRVQVDDRHVSVPEGTTVLRAAELAGIEIPSLCAHKELSPFGGCRLCAVEITGMRGYPLACSTMVRDGMEVTTASAALREMRRQVLQLILSQHPSACLLCGEKDECRRSQTTIRKAGVSTGCRSCPNDGQCELQAVVERVGVDELDYPVSYRGLEPEHDDPFFDRDYNLCILCGRCVRMCHEVRGASVLSFKYRGRQTLIGPAFGSSHVDAGCEFCGACVSVCPTGALVDKVSKWDGMPDGSQTTTCPFCGVGCQLELTYAHGALSASQPAHDIEIDDGQLCVLGRFCLPETTHHHTRARKPMLRRGAYLRVVSWEEALGEVADRLRQVAPDELLMLVSGDLTNEGLHAAQRLVHLGLGSPGLDSSCRAYLPGGPGLWSRLFSLPVSIRALGEADVVVVIAFDSRFSFSVAGVQVRRALRRGAHLAVIDARESNLARMADHWLRVRSGDEAQALSRLLRRAHGQDAGGGLAASSPEEEALATVSRLIREARGVAVVMGPRVFDCAGAEELVGDLETLAARGGCTVVPLVHGANVRGALELGVVRDVPAAPAPLDLAQLRGGRPPRVLYLVGEVPFTARPDCDFLIAQDLYLPPFEVDAFLPAASFAEADGTLTNLEGRVQEVHAVERAQGGPVPDWHIFSELAGRLGRPDLQYADAAAVRASIRDQVRGFPIDHDRSPRRMAPTTVRGGTGHVGVEVAGAESPVSGTPGSRTPGRGRFLLVLEHSAYGHRGSDLTAVVEGLAELHLEEGLRVNPDDLAHLGVEPGGLVTVAVDDDGASIDLALAARSDPECPPGAVYLTRPEAWGGLAGAAGQPTLERLAHLPLIPIPVRIRAGDRTRGSRPATGASAARPPYRAAAGSRSASDRPGGGHGQGR